MGYLYQPTGISTFPYDFAQMLVEAYDYSVFIETGTFNGDNAVRCKQFFKTVYTVEASSKCYESAMSRHGTSTGVHFEFGDSRDVLSRICMAAHGKKIFWLDAHYCGSDAFKNESPLLEELKIINHHSKEDSIIFVDDARFIHSVYQEERYAEYPELIALLASDVHRYIVCINDAFIAVPRVLKNDLDAYCKSCLEQERFLESPVPWAVKIKKFVKFILSKTKIIRPQRM